jgi:hypothetical protein
MSVETYQIYKQLYPAPQRTNVLTEDVMDDLECRIPALFNFNIAQNNVATLLSVHETALLTFIADFDGSFKKSTDYRYIVDNLTYRATLLCVPFTLEDGRVTYNFNIKLSNDGFLYPPNSELTIFRGPLKRHDSSHWYQLDKKERNKFSCAESFARKVLPGGKHVISQFYYNRTDQRMDIKFLERDSGTAVIFTFEPGYPEDDDFEDHWFELEESS